MTVRYFDLGGNFCILREIDTFQSIATNGLTVEPNRWYTYSRYVHRSQYKPSSWRSYVRYKNM